MTGLTLYRHQIITITGWVMRVSVLAGVLCFLLVSIGNADPASAAIRKPTNIPAEPLDLALKTLDEGAAVPGALPRRTRAGCAHGRSRGRIHSRGSDQAAPLGVGSTDTVYSILKPSPYSLRPPETANPVPSGVTPHDGDELNKEAGKNSSQDFRVAQVDQGQTPGPSTVEKQDNRLLRRRNLISSKRLWSLARAFPGRGERSSTGTQLYPRGHCEQRTDHGGRVSQHAARRLVLHAH